MEKNFKYLLEERLKYRLSWKDDYLEYFKHQEITEKTSIVRELHVFGKAISIGEKEEDSFQHQGIGKKLMIEAEKIAATDLSSDKLCVISAVGTR